MSKRILVADDSTNTRGILRFMLQNQGFEILEVENGKDALDQAIASPPDLIILDGMMPKMSGFEACTRLKKNPKTAAIPVILLTAIAQIEPNHDWSKEAPADRFMAKPFQLKDLLGTIESLLGLTPVSETSIRRKSDLDPRPQGTTVRPRTT